MQQLQEISNEQTKKDQLKVDEMKRKLEAEKVVRDM